MPKSERDILEQIIFAKTGNQIVELFNKMPEIERQEIAPFFLKQLKDFDRPEKLQQFLSERAGKFITEDAISDRPGLNQRIQIAIIATANLKEIKQVFRNNTWGLRMIDDYVEPILRVRQPNWLSDFFIWSCEFTDHTFWPIYRRLCLDGVVERVLHETVIRAMFAYLPHEYIYHDDYDPASKPTSIVPLLEKNPDLLEHEVWRLFEFVSFPSNWSLTSWDRENQWNDAISTFIERGTLDKYRIMGGCFQCLDKAFTEQQAKWYAHLLERVPLTDEELQREQKRFLALLDNPNPTTSSLGLKIMERLFKSGLLDDKLAVTYLLSVLREPSKGKAKRGVALLDKLVKRTPALRQEIFHVLLEGLQHESADIQNAALAALSKHGALNDSEIMDSIRQIADLLSPSVRVELNLDAPRSEVSERIPPTVSPVLKQTAPEPLAAIQSLDDLFDLAARIVEVGGSVEEGEQLLDGISRLCLEHPANWEVRIKPILKRLEHVYNSFPSFGRDFFFPMLDVISAWLGQSRSKSTKPRYAILRNPLNPDWIFQNRCNDIVANVRNAISSQILSFPSHRGYGISATALLERVRQNRDRFDAVSIFDQIQALFRLIPGDRGTLLTAIEGKDFALTKNDACSYGHFYHVLKYVCGGPEIPEDVPSDYREVGIQIRSLYDSVPNYEFCIRETPQEAWWRKGKMLSASAMESEKIPGLRIWNSLNIPTHTESRQLANEHLAAVCPHNMEPYYAHGCIVLGMDVDTKSRMNENAVFLNALLASHNSLGSAGTALVLIALASQAPPVQQCGIDALIHCVNTGRIEPEMLRKTFASLLPLEVFKPIRWTKSLAVCAAESGLHAGLIHQLIEETLMHVPNKELAAFLALLLELSLSTGRKITCPAARSFLETVSGKTATVAKKLLEL